MSTLEDKMERLVTAAMAIANAKEPVGKAQTALSPRRRSTGDDQFLTPMAERKTVPVATYEQNQPEHYALSPEVGFQEGTRGGNNGGIIRSAIGIVSQLPAPEAVYKGHGDQRSASYFQYEVAANTVGLNAACVFFYLKRYVALEIFERIPIVMNQDPSLHHYEMAVETSFAWLKRTYDTMAATERLLQRWQRAQQESHERPEDFCFKVRKLRKERTLMGIQPTELECMSLLRNGFNDSRINFWISLHQFSDYEDLERNLLNYSSQLSGVALVANAAVVSNTTERPKYNTGCPRCRDRNATLHDVKDCKSTKPAWWSDSTCLTCGQQHDTASCSNKERFVRRPCKRCNGTHSISVCGLTPPKTCAAANQVGDAGLLKIPLQLHNSTLQILGVLDSGATDNIMDRSILDTINKSLPQPLRQEALHNTELLVADGSRVAVRSRVQLKVILPDGTATTLSILVVDHLSQKFLLSERTLRKLGCVWVMGENTDKLVVGKNAQQLSRELLQRDDVRNNGFEPVRDGAATRVCNCVQAVRKPLDDETPLPQIRATDHFTSIIPWLSPDKRPRLNINAAMARDSKAISRLNPDERGELQALVQQLVDHGVLEEVEMDKCKYFLPLRIVRALTKNTKLRVTVDAREFNEYVRSGNNACKHMRQVFIHWRLQAFYICTDLKRAFYSIRIHSKEKPWLSLIIAGKAYQYGRLPMGLTYSPKALEQVLAEIEKLALSGTVQDQTAVAGKSVPNSIEDIPNCDFDTDGFDRTQYKCHKFVDDIHFGGDSPISCIDSCKFGIRLFHKYGFQASADKTFTNIPDIPWLPKHSGMMLGHYTEGEEIIQTFTPDSIPTEATRSELVSILTSAWYDPYGLNIEFTLLHKLILSRVVEGSAGWEAPVNAEVVREAKEFADEHRGRPFRTVRHITGPISYVFVDASATHWCVDLRDARLTRVFAQNGRLSRTSTVPRGELDALRRGTALVEKLAADLPFKQVIYFTDSMITIMRLRRPQLAQPPYEARRLEAIRAAVSKQGAMVVHVESALNLADAGTKVAAVTPPIEAVLAFVTQLAKSKESATYVGLQEEESEPEEFELHSANIATRQQSYHLPTSLPAIPTRLDDAELRRRIREEQVKFNIEVQPHYEQEEEDGLVVRVSDISVIHGNSTPLRQAIIPAESTQLIKEVVEGCHRAAGHLDPSRTMGVLRRQFYFKNMRQTVKRILEGCESCRLGKTQRSWSRYAGIQPWTHGLWRVVGIDHAYLPVQEQLGKRYNGYLSLTDYVSKYTVAVPSTTRTCAEVLGALDQTFGILGFPQVLVYDGSTSFVNEQFHQYLKTNAIQGFQISAYAAESAGFFERGHKTLKSMLRAKLVEVRNIESWPDLLQRCVVALNHIPYDSSVPGLHPSLLNLGYQARLPGMLDIDFNAEEDLHLPTPDVEEIMHHRRSSLGNYVAFWERRRGEIRQTLLKRGRPRKLEVGNNVYIYRPRSDPLQSEWQPGGRIVALEGDSQVKIELPDGREIVEHRINILPTNDATAGPPM